MTITSVGREERWSGRGQPCRYIRYPLALFFFFLTFFPSRRARVPDQGLLLLRIFLSAQSAWPSQRLGALGGIGSSKGEVDGRFALLARKVSSSERITPMVLFLIMLLILRKPEK